MPSARRHVKKISQKIPVTPGADDCNKDIWTNLEKTDPIAFRNLRCASNFFANFDQFCICNLSCLTETYNCQ